MDHVVVCGCDLSRARRRQRRARRRGDTGGRDVLAVVRDGEARHARRGRQGAGPAGTSLYMRKRLPRIAGSSNPVCMAGCFGPAENAPLRDSVLCSLRKRLCQCLMYQQFKKLFVERGLSVAQYSPSLCGLAGSAAGAHANI